MQSMNFEEIKARVEELKPGASYVLRVERHVTREVAEQIIEAWEKEAPNSAHLLILDGGMQLTELTDEQLYALGRRRIWEGGDARG